MDNLKYKVTDASKKTVSVKGVVKKKSSVTIPATVSYGGADYKVTGILAKAFKENSKMTKLVIGANIEKIGKSAFEACSNLKNIIIKTKNLVMKNVGKKAFMGDKPKKVKVPKGMKKSYEKILQKRGL